MALIVTLKEKVAQALKQPDLANAFRQIEIWANNGGASGLLPVGAVVLFMGSVQTGYLPLLGGTFNVSQYPALASYLGVSSGTFTLPNMTNVFPMGSNAYGATGGTTAHTHVEATHAHTSAAHTHTLSDSAWAALSWGAAGLIQMRRLTSGAWTETVQSSSSTAVPLTGGTTTGITTGVGLLGSTDSTTPGNTGSTAPGNTASTNNLPPFRAFILGVKY